mmetsp:Transcript_30481/g.85328  ORF Transcript_30481/g.85328 Transcript_30481/m.85328 type:complete len:466 (-) Transcript_30481:1839-3236(-)
MVSYDLSTFRVLVARGALGRDGPGKVTFMDLDGEGSIDAVFPVCRSSPEALLTDRADCALENSIRVVYNTQKTLCASTYTSDDCRDQYELCASDPSYTLGDFASRTPSGDVVIAATEAFGPYRFYDRKSLPPLQLRVGDFNLDGFPDILVPLIRVTAGADLRDAPPAAAGRSGPLRGLLGDVMSGSGAEPPERRDTAVGTVEMSLWQNVPCMTQLCSNTAIRLRRRSFAHVTGDEVQQLRALDNPFAAAFFDIDETGTPDVMVLSEGIPEDPTRRRIHFLANNMHNDAFFLKTLGLNGLCTSWCSGPVKFPDPRPYGVNFAGGVFKFIVTDLRGNKRIAASGQLSQSGHLALQLPYTLHGLGRAGNYIDLIYYGIPYQAERNWQSWICIIPNSQLVAVPHPPGNPENWQLELYITPSSVTATVVFCMFVSLLVLAVIIYALSWREKAEDERERQERSHLFSFDAL